MLQQDVQIADNRLLPDLAGNAVKAALLASVAHLGKLHLRHVRHAFLGLQGLWSYGMKSGVLLAWSCLARLCMTTLQWLPLLRTWLGSWASLWPPLVMALLRPSHSGVRSYWHGSCMWQLQSILGLHV